MPFGEASALSVSEDQKAEIMAIVISSGNPVAGYPVEHLVRDGRGRCVGLWAATGHDTPTGSTPSA